MSISKEELYKIAHLARLRIRPDQEDQLIGDMEDILSWMDKLKELDTSNVEPLINMSYEINNQREDVPKNTIIKKEALKNAPKHDGEYFLVPKVLDKKK